MSESRCIHDVLDKSECFICTPKRGAEPQMSARDELAFRFARNLCEKTGRSPEGAVGTATLVAFKAGYDIHEARAKLLHDALLEIVALRIKPPAPAEEMQLIAREALATYRGSNE